MQYSFIIPLYNRPDEIRELLESISRLTGGFDFEVIVVEDGSKVPSKDIVEGFADRLDVKYIYQDNTGPGGARNRGAHEALGQTLIILDSDTVLPEDYLVAVDRCRVQRPASLWGGPDRASEDFTVVQRAIDYSMTSFFTTGGIRGGKKRLDKFYPRSFNMGVDREVFLSVGGFRAMRFGEDLDLSMRIIEAGHHSECYEEAWLYHKRRVSYVQFFRQVYNSGIARITLNKLHPGTLKLVHWLPALFVIGHVALFLLAVFHTPYWLMFPLVYALLICCDLFIRTGWMDLAVHGIIASYVQLFGYGLGFLHSFRKQVLMKQGNFTKFENNFYD
ncbi:glycosyltransferase family 2 protein [Porphyromonas sp.]|uniref:glycosyltransferase n=1 Tax=Porphyromonas sp. TaxID=1924944 RepID=UPI0026DB1F36|nr:glycosyltransferase [Porphyromonas sp.]MDO4695119.1 glycosyltransferase [Porphyromonas sp.]MDO4770236.1 glycosyltransferase [Porphyromonas sp.]